MIAVNCNAPEISHGALRFLSVSDHLCSLYNVAKGKKKILCSIQLSFLYHRIL
jgi:hypothetical protein